MDSLTSLADMTAEEIFNMFFGGGFPTHTVGRGGMRFRQQAHFQRHFQHQHHHHGDDNRREVCNGEPRLRPGKT